MRAALEVCREMFGTDVHGAEIGVLGGTNAVSMLTSWPELSVLHLVDSYGGITDQDPRFREWVKRFDQFGERITWHIMTSVQAASRLAAESLDLDFVYIDANHRYWQVKQDCCAWWPIVKAGGILCGHDWRTHGSVQKAVKSWAHQNGLGVSEGDNDWWIAKDIPFAQPAAALCRECDILDMCEQKELVR